MKNLFIWTIFLLLTGVIITCTPDDDSRTTEKPMATIEGLYVDTVTLIRTNYSFIDSVVYKNVYKINDSTFWMPGFFEIDSFFVNIIANPVQYIDRYFTFKVRPDNTVQYINNPAGTIIYYYNCSSSLEWWDLKNYFIISRCYGILTPGDAREIHRMRKL